VSRALPQRDPVIVLASASPRRRELLTAIGVPFLVDPADVDETPGVQETPYALVRRLAEAKATAVLARRGADLPVLGADTLVVVDGRVLGKPRDRADALGMLQRLSGRSHEVLTALALANAGDVQVVLSRTRVWFRELEAGEAERYWATGEPRDKAGAYGIQGIGGIFVDRLEGSYSAVVGLPVAETDRLLRRFGIDGWAERIPMPATGDEPRADDP
jgi:septum formation protein